MDRELHEIVSRIEFLLPRKRRLLFRHLKVMGLLESDDLLSDRNPLKVAPALQSVLTDSTTGPVARTDSPAAPPRPGDRPQLGSNQSPVNRPGTTAAPAAETAVPAEVPPLSRLAPAEPVRIVFDGGSRGNPGEGYGSYALDWPGQPRQIVRLSFGDNATSNEAEYDTLIAALEAVQRQLLEQGMEPESTRVDIWGDSQLVCKQVRGDWRCKEPRLQRRLKEARALLGKFGGATLDHHPREKSVEILGH